MLDYKMDIFFSYLETEMETKEKAYNFIIPHCTKIYFLKYSNH